MEFFKKETKFDFMGMRKYTASLFIALWVFSVGCLMHQGLNLGLEFTGGTQLELRFQSVVSPALIRNVLEKDHFSGVRVQQYGELQDILIRLSGQEDEKTVGTRIAASLAKQGWAFELRRIEFVGSEVGAQLMDSGIIAVILGIVATMLYIALRFEYRLAVSAAVGLLHDGILILGAFSLFSIEFNLSALASLLAVLGYSLNDTIVVFDRVRETFRKVRHASPIEIMNLSINQTLSRTIMTSFMTLLVVLALLIFGGEALFSFSMAFFMGIIVGTFSSIYVSGALALWLGLSRADLATKPRVDLI
jgi:preprotein translocase subunit SecF